MSILFRITFPNSEFSLKICEIWPGLQAGSAEIFRFQNYTSFLFGFIVSLCCWSLFQLRERRKNPNVEYLWLENLADDDTPYGRMQIKRHLGSWLFWIMQKLVAKNLFESKNSI